MVGKMSRLVTTWNRYWFRPAPLLDLAIARIVATSVQLFLLLFVRDRIDRALRLASLPDVFFKPLPALRLVADLLGLSPRLVPDEIVFVAWVTIACGLLGMVGLMTNVSLLVFTMGNLLLNAFVYSFGEFHHTEGIMMLTLLILCLSPCGRVFSVDSVVVDFIRRRIGRRKDDTPILARMSVYARWPGLLVAWLYGLIYLSAAAAKISRGGLDWMNGYTLQFNLLDSGVRSVTPLGVWLGQQHHLLILLSWVVIVFESTFWIVPLVPRLTWVYVPLGISLHLGILLAMGPDFYEFFALYAAIIPWTAIASYFPQTRSTLNLII
jgi:hypothetical protein